jgi:hypothetical protein
MVEGMVKKNAAAVELGRRGGQKKVPKGFSTLTPEQRSAIAKKGVQARRAKAKKKAKGKPKHLYDRKRL